MSTLLIVLILGVFLFASHFLVEIVASIQERRAARVDDVSVKTPAGAGAFRSVYAYMVCALQLALFSLLLPLALDFKNQLQQAHGRPAAFLLFLKTATLPVLMLVLLLYSGRRNALRWIKEASWPRD